MAHPITNLPGLSEAPNFEQYSGYITVDAHAGRQLFYWYDCYFAAVKQDVHTLRINRFAESQSNPTSDPVVLWLTGGPGCSSIDALFTENGPFIPDDSASKLTSNPYRYIHW